MNQLNITVVAYGIATIVMVMLAATFLLGRRREGWFSLAALACAGWMCVTGLLHLEMPLRFFLQIEAIQYSFWILALGKALSQVTNNQATRGQKSLLLASAALSTWVFLDLFTPIIYSSRVLFLIFLLQAIVGLLSVEQLYRNANVSRYFKLLCLLMGLFFFFEMMANTHSLIFQSRSENVIQARAAVVFATAFLMIVGILLFPPSDFRSGAPRISLSRPTALYTTSLIASGAFIVVASFGAYFINTYGGSWGWVAFILFAFLASVALCFALFSRTFRMKLAVLVNKHLYQHKYDYRDEWLKFINRLSHPRDNRSVLHTAFTAMSSVFQAPGGAIWLKRGYYYAPLYQSGMSEEVELPKEPVDTEFCKILKTEGWVFIPGAIKREMQKNNPAMPRWLGGIPDAWLVVPLLSGSENQLVGFLMLTKPAHNELPTWEDLDLLKLTGRELANYLKLHEQSEQLAENLQFDAYNKLTAFIMHDINNVIAQQSLVVSNAAKHKHNPEFIDDAIDTISNSVARMDKLMHRLKRSDSQAVELLSLADVIQSAIDSCAGSKPVPAYTTLSRDVQIYADRDRIELAISHLLKNAQEATDDTGAIDVVLNRDNDMAVIAITDSGAGMDEFFVENQLFKPFQTTKSGKGMGIGVYLTRSYINQLGGTLDVTSRPGRGTTFSIRLKVAAP